MKVESTSFAELQQLFKVSSLNCPIFKFKLASYNSPKNDILTYDGKVFSLDD